MMKKKIIVFLIVFLAVFIPANNAVMQAYEIETYPIEKSETFDDYIRTDYRDQISEEEPRFVVIGDSAIRELEEDTFSRILGNKTLIFSAPGSGSAYWYLFFRNEVLTSQHLPDVVFFFFRTVTLTNPSYLVTGSYYTKLEEVASGNDMDVYALAIGTTKNPLLTIPEKYIPMFAYRSEIYENFVAQVRNWLPGLFLDCDAACVDKGFDQVFDETQINAFLWEELVRNLDSSLDNKENYDFDANIDGSLLPLMLNDARSMGITPIFVRNKYRSQALGERDSPELAQYMRELKTYIQQHGGLFIDLGENDALTADMYRDAIHFNYDDAPEASRIIAWDIMEQIKFLIQLD